MTKIRKEHLIRISQKFDKKTNQRRYRIHHKLNKYFSSRNIYVKINSNTGIIEVPITISDEIKCQSLPVRISRYFHELIDLRYTIQIVLN